MMKNTAYFLIFIGIAGIGGAVDLAESPTKAISILIIGLMILALSSKKKGVRNEKSFNRVSYHDASYPSYLSRR